MTAVRPTGSEKTPIFRLLAGIAVPPMSVLAKLKLTGVENVPATGAFVLAPNHYSEIDPLIIGVAMWKVGRMPRYMAKASLFSVPIIGRLLRASGQIPVERAGSMRGSDPLAAAKRIADQGLAVVIYPEGSLTRDPDLWPMRGKTGAVRTALEQGIPVIPVAHWGTQLVMPRYGKKINVFPRKTVNVRFGPPVDLSAFAGRKLDTATLMQATDVVMDAITELFEQLRGEKAPAERWDPSQHNQKDTGRFEQ
ncbi:MAG: 1-acyl-sn-glycerol-3-phosphate acyltransferase [Microbacteriaceae bacterium]|nr:1-acyl-sn-glycerol-3-phosphate acyltransferase [Microbacteriaceae bacterium]